MNRWYICMIQTQNWELPYSVARYSSQGENRFYPIFQRAHQEKCTLCRYRNIQSNRKKISALNFSHWTISDWVTENFLHLGLNILLYKYTDIQLTPAQECLRKQYKIVMKTWTAHKEEKSPADRYTRTVPKETDFSCLPSRLKIFTTSLLRRN